VPKPPDKNRDACRQAIRNAIRDHGPDKAGAIVRSQFPDVNDQTLKGWLAAEKRDARMMAEKVIEAVPMPARGRGRPPLDLAPVPMPTMEIRAISDARRQITRSNVTRAPTSFFDRFDELECDLARVRSACVKIGPDGNERVVNPAALLLCVREARANLKLAQEHAEMAHTVERMGEMAQAMADIVSTAINDLPEAQRLPAVKRFRALVVERQNQIERVDPEMAAAIGGFGG